MGREDRGRIQAADERRKRLIGPCIASEVRLNNNGYGKHREAYQKAYGEIPQGYDVAHLCHNRACVNPEHLTLATRSENMAMSQGRPKRGRLNSLQIKAIRDLRAMGYQQREIAQALDLNGSTVCKLLLGMSYR